MSGAAAALQTGGRIATFLTRAGHAGAAVAPLAGDASNRRYLRIATASGTLVLMDAPTVLNERMDIFVEVTRWLRSLGLSAPEVVFADLDEGLLLLEDLGDALYARAIDGESADELTLYGAATDLLADLPQDGAVPQGIGRYDSAALLREARLVTDWYAAGQDRSLSEDALAEFDALVDAATADVAESTAVTVLRDYHAENLIWLPGRAGNARVGLLDYQDALAGHPAYDLVSLLEDARRDTSRALQSAMIARYIDRRALRGAEAEAFRAAYDVLGAQRNLKIVGIFARLALRDGKPRYLSLIPRVWRHLERDLSAPALAPLSAFVARHIPPPEPGALDMLAARRGTGLP